MQITGFEPVSPVDWHLTIRRYLHSDGYESWQIHNRPKQQRRKRRFLLQTNLGLQLVRPKGFEPFSGNNNTAAPADACSGTYVPNLQIKRTL